MRNGCNARELRAFFRGFAQELGNRQEHVTCWLWRQSSANSSPVRIPCSPGRNREFQQKPAFSGDGRREKPR